MAFYNPFSMFRSFLNPQAGYQAAEGASNQGYRQAQDYYNWGQNYLLPYYSQGKAQYPILMGAENKLLNPEALESQWASGYQTSPYAQRELDISKGQGLDAASAMGLMGSSAAGANIQQKAGDIVSQDRQQYLNDLMQKYMAGIGISTGLYSGGLQAAGSLSNNAMDFAKLAEGQGENMAGLRYGETNAPGELFGNLMKTAAGAYGAYSNPGAYNSNNRFNS